MAHRIIPVSRVCKLRNSTWKGSDKKKKKNSEEKTLTFRLTHAICQELSTMGALELRTSANAFLLLRGGSSYLVPEEIRECNDASVPKGPKKYMHSRDGEGNQLT